MWILRTSFAPKWLDVVNSVHSVQRLVRQLRALDLNTSAAGSGYIQVDSDRKACHWRMLFICDQWCKFSLLCHKEWMAPLQALHRDLPRLENRSRFQASDYWKYVVAKFNKQFAKEFNAKPADVPSRWQLITRKEAEASVKVFFNIKWETTCFLVTEAHILINIEHPHMDI